LLKVATSFFLITICGREQVAQIRGKAIYKITDVALIPLSSQDEAQQALTSAREHAQRQNKARTEEDESTDTESEGDDTLSATDSLVDAAPTPPKETKDPLTGQRGVLERRTSVAQDVIRNKGMYGRFAERWFSKKGWSTESRRVQGLSSEEDLAASKKPKDVESTVPEETEHAVTTSDNKALPVADKEAPEAVNPEEIPKALEGQKDSTTVALLPKILRTTKMYFGSGNFFFSYDYDISRGIGQQQSQSSLPLFLQTDPLVSQFLASI
jgi:hypothetical protein